MRLRKAWINVDPGDRKTGDDMTINVGLGAGGGLPVLGSWKIDPTTGKTELCISDDTQCVEVTPQP